MWLTDLKPGNILLVHDSDNADGERPKILDFGIAKLAADPSAKALTRVGVSMGTPAYMSPELCKDARDVTDRSDVYALGLILFEMLAGQMFDKALRKMIGAFEARAEELYGLGSVPALSPSQSTIS